MQLLPFLGISDVFFFFFSFSSFSSLYIKIEFSFFFCSFPLFAFCCCLPDALLTKAFFYPATISSCPSLDSCQHLTKETTKERRGKNIIIFSSCEHDAGGSCCKVCFCFLLFLHLFCPSIDRGMVALLLHAENWLFWVGRSMHGPSIAAHAFLDLVYVGVNYDTAEEYLYSYTVIVLYLTPRH